MRNFKFKYIVKGFLFISIFCLITQGYLRINNKFYTETNYNVFLWEDIYKGESFDIVYVGDSQVFSGINPYIMDEVLNKNNFNLCAPAQRIMDSYYSLKEFYKYNTPEVVFLDIKNSRLYKSNNTSYSYNVFNQMKPSQDKYEYFFAIDGADYKLKLLFPFIGRGNIETIKNTAKYIYNKLFNNTEEASEIAAAELLPIRNHNYLGKGFLPYREGSRNVPPFMYSQIWHSGAVDSKTLNLYKKTIDLCKSNGSKVVLISMPYSDYFFRAMKNYDEYYSYVSELASTYDVDIIDFNFIRPDIYTPDKKYFYEGFHFTKEGADVFTTAVSGIILEYINNTFELDKYFLGSYEEVIKEREALK